MVRDFAGGRSQDISDPRGMVEDVTGVGRWGNWQLRSAAEQNWGSFLRCGSGAPGTGATDGSGRRGL